MRFSNKRYPRVLDCQFYQGFTLVELMITLLVAGVLAGFAVPSLFSFVQNSRLTTDINKLVTSMNLARSEAIKRGANIRIAATDSSDSANEWGKGWSVWVDLNGDTTIDAGEDLLSTDQALSDSMQLDSAGGITSFVYRADGSINGAADAINLCDSKRTGETGRSASISANGRVNLISEYSCP